MDSGQGYPGVANSIHGATGSSKGRPLPPCGGWDRPSNAYRRGIIEAREPTSGDFLGFFRFPLFRGLASFPRVSPGFLVLAQ
jgi:hypothetical protein